jgi:hypothetical protein
MSMQIDNYSLLYMSLAGASESQEIAFPQLQLCRRRYGLPLGEIPIDGQEGKYSTESQTLKANFLKRASSG